MAEAPKKKDAKADDELKPVIKDGKRGQILRFRIKLYVYKNKSV